MLTRNHSVIREIRRIVEQECTLHERYQAALKEELHAITHLDTDEIEACVLKRAALTENLAAVQEKRVALVQQHAPALTPQEPPTKLSAWLEKNCHPEDLKPLKPLIGRLKVLTQRTRSKLLELGCVVDFSHGVVTSALSLIWSGAQPVTKTYDGTGRIQQRHLPPQQIEHGSLRRV
jgi:hypothetical protein